MAIRLISDWPASRTWFIDYYHNTLLQALAEIVKALSDGGFSASLSGRFFHDMALDKAHEMLIKIRA